MEEAFRALLRDGAALAGRRVEYLERPTVTPCIRLQVIYDLPSHTYSGPDGLALARVQVDCIALDFPAAKALQRQVDALLGAVAPLTPPFRSALRVVDRSDDHEPGEGGDPALFRSRLDVEFTHATST